MFVFSIVFMFSSVLFLILFNVFCKAEQPKNTLITLDTSKIVMNVGILDIITAAILIVAFSVFSSEQPHVIFYIISLFFFLLGGFLCYYAIRFKVFVGETEFIIYPLFSKKTIISYNDISYIRREVKNNRTNSERLVIVVNNKKYIIEQTCLAYKKFLKFICDNIPHEKLLNFFNYKI